MTINLAQALGLAYFLQRWSAVEPFAELDTQDIRCDGGEFLRVTLYANAPLPHLDDWSREAFISDEGALFRWEQNPEVPLDLDDVSTWGEGWFVPLDVSWVRALDG